MKKKKTKEELVEFLNYQILTQCVNIDEDLARLRLSELVSLLFIVLEYYFVILGIEISMRLNELIEIIKEYIKRN